MNEAIRNVSLKFQCKMISLNNMNITCAGDHRGSSKFLLNDGIHPSTVGHKLIAKKVIHDMKTDPVSWNTRNDL
jgi:phospholipase/lecithinase/hemolysin